MFGFRKSHAAPEDRGDATPSAFVLDERALIDEVMHWADLAQPIVSRSGAAAEADFTVLKHALHQIVRAVRDPDRRIGRTMRADVMEVLRKEAMEQHGFDPLAIAQALRKIASRAAWSTVTPREDAQVATGASHAAEVDRLRKKVLALQEMVDHLSVRPGVEDAIV